MMKLAPVVVAISLLATRARAGDCASLIETAESTQGPAAVSVAKQAVAACKVANIKTARPYMVLAVEANRAGKLSEVISWSKQGLEQEPGLPLAYMNICAAQSQMKKFDDAVKSCTDGLKEPSAWSAKLNFNIGLALFQKAVAAEKFGETLKAEPYFLESRKLDASIGQNHYYLGILAENVKADPTAALAHYEAGCKVGDQQSCVGAGRVKGKAGSQQVAQQQPTVPIGADEAKLWAAVEDGYRKKGLDEASLKDMITRMKSGLATVPAEQRMQSLRQMLDALK